MNQFEHPVYPFGYTTSAPHSRGYLYPPMPQFSQPQQQEAQNQTTMTITVHDNDILMGRGGKNNMHIGNEKLRQLARAKASKYIKADKREKSLMSLDLVAQVHAMTPAGRFLKRDPVSMNWQLVPSELAREKASQCLRDAVSQIKKRRDSDSSSSAGSAMEGISTPSSKATQKMANKQQRPAPVTSHSKSLIQQHQAQQQQQQKVRSKKRGAVLVDMSSSQPTMMRNHKRQRTTPQKRDENNNNYTPISIPPAIMSDMLSNYSPIPLRNIHNPSVVSEDGLPFADFDLFFDNHSLSGAHDENDHGLDVSGFQF
ncbi:expressed unknown protein [Seminavis robusta]|uniref:DUF6824 domain-containing protein n=1 Tax=Seminavis robusta TaxID=568900 RepID=A0A9N8E2W8_9STRA|nr:expressed unknown protein [Seminavis robusta]|eukprot:Sro449_g145390.1 n/a (313) ;mRNA; f:54349-55384